MSAPERDALAIGMPRRAYIIAFTEKFRRQLSWWFSVEACEVDFGYPNHVLQGRAVEQNLRAIWRPAWAGAEPGDLTFDSAQRRNYKQSASITLRTEDQAGAVRRPIRLPVVSWRGCHSHRIAFADWLHPEVEIAAPIGTVGNHFSVGRPGRLALQTGIIGQARQFLLQRRLPSLESLADQWSHRDDRCDSNEQRRKRNSHTSLVEFDLAYQEGGAQCGARLRDCIAAGRRTFLNDSFRFFLIQLLKAGDKAVAPPRDCYNVPMLVRVFAQSLAQRRDTLRQVVLLDYRVRPDPPHQFILLHDLSARLN